MLTDMLAMGGGGGSINPLKLRFQMSQAMTGTQYLYYWDDAANFNYKKFKMTESSGADDVGYQIGSTRVTMTANQEYSVPNNFNTTDNRFLLFLQKNSSSVSGTAYFEFYN